MSQFALEKIASLISKQKAFHPGPVHPPSGEVSPLLSHPIDRGPGHT